MPSLSIMTHNPSLIEIFLEEAEKAGAQVDRAAGDTKHIWDKDNPGEVAAAKELFKSLTKRGKHVAYKVTGKGEPGEQIREFDPDAESMILVPQMAGG